jgi:NTP pyrophosphatase (non-canonical NTP hydrolase)
MKSKFNLQEVQSHVEDWINRHGGYWSPLSMLSAMMEELGELAREINHLEGFKPKKNEDMDTKIGEELGDLFFALVCMANYYEIDLSNEILKTISKYSKRDSFRFK